MFGLTSIESMLAGLTDGSALVSFETRAQFYFKLAHFVDVYVLYIWSTRGFHVVIVICVMAFQFSFCEAGG